MKAGALPPANVRVELEGGPDGLTVALDGKPTPVPIAIPAGFLRFTTSDSRPLAFEPRALKADGSRDWSIVLDMKPVTVAPAVVKSPEPAQSSPSPSPKTQYTSSQQSQSGLPP